MTRARSIPAFALAALLALAWASLAPQLQAAVQQPAPTPQPVAVNLPAGDDAWMTPPDGGTSIDFVADPLPAGFFGAGSLAFSGKIPMKGVPLATNPPGALGVADTLVRRLGATGPLAVGGTATVAIEFIALRLTSINNFRVHYAGGAVETWRLDAALSPTASQNIGTMDITRTSGDGGEYTSTLLGLFHLTFTRVNPAPAITRVLDCGAGDCDEMVFAATGASWTLIGGPNNWQPSQLQIDPLPPGVNVDANGDGIPDGVLTVGKSNFQVGVKWVPGGGGGGGGEGECDGTDHINGQSKIETHTSFLAGDSDADGKPNDCDDCTDADGDGVDDLTGETCASECEEPAPTGDGTGDVEPACPEPHETEG